STPGGGGGIYNDSYNGIANLTINGSTLSGNTASDGGGIYNIDENTVILQNSTLSGNTANNTGGALFTRNQYDYAAVTLTNCTLSGNAANSGSNGGGGIFFYNDNFDPPTTNVVTLRNTILANASGGNIFNDIGVGFLNSQGHNLSSDGG